MCEAASLRESSEQLWVGGANGNACGWRSYDKYLPRQEERDEKRGKVQRWKTLITFEAG